jgi:hypothetical protein
MQKPPNKMERVSAQIMHIVYMEEAQYARRSRKRWRGEGACSPSVCSPDTSPRPLRAGGSSSGPSAGGGRLTAGPQGQGRPGLGRPGAGSAPVICRTLRAGTRLRFKITRKKRFNILQPRQAGLSLHAARGGPRANVSMLRAEGISPPWAYRTRVATPGLVAIVQRGEGTRPPRSTLGEPECGVEGVNPSPARD